MLRRAIVILLGIITVAVSSVASATIVRPFTLRGLAVEAHEVVRGEVVDEEVVYDAWWDRVYTHTTVLVHEAIEGQVRPGDLIVLRQIGGILDGIQTRVVGTTTYALGDEVVLFTRTDGALHYLVGMSQGSYFISRNADGETVVSRSTGTVTLAPRRGAAGHLAPDQTALATLWARVSVFRKTAVTP